MCLDLTDFSPKFQFDWPASKQNYCRVFIFSLFRVFVFQIVKKLLNTAMAAMASKFLYLKDVS